MWGIHQWFYIQLLNFAIMSIRKILLLLLVSNISLHGFTQSITEEPTSEVNLPFRAGNGLNLEFTMVFSMPAMLH